jgi:hypothetical protein
LVGEAATAILYYRVYKKALNSAVDHISYPRLPSPKLSQKLVYLAKIPGLPGSVRRFTIMKCSE